MALATRTEKTVSDSNNNGLGNLTPAEVAAVRAMRAEQSERAACQAFQRKAIATAHAFEEWSAKTGDGLTFSTFINAFDYQDGDGRLMFEAVQRIQQAALPL